MDEAVANVKNLFNLNDDYAVLFLTGGASTQFFMSVMNLADESDKIGYLNTGTWSDKAIKEAKKLCDTVEIASSKDINYTYIPKGYDMPTDIKYLHITSNNHSFWYSV